MLEPRAVNETRTEKSPTDWLADTQECWLRLPNKTFFFGLLFAWVALFVFLGNSTLGYVHTRSIFGWLYEAYNSPGSAEDAGHGNFIPFLVVGIFWWKRKQLLKLPLTVWAPGIFIVAAALVLHAAGYLVQQPVLSVVALFLGIFGLMGLAWGSEWLRHSLYPYLLFVFSIPMASHLNFILFPLRLMVCWLVEMASHLIGIDVIRRGTELFDPSGKFQYEVAAACGGMRSLVAIILLATVYAFAIFHSPKKRFLLIASAIPFAVLGNFVRLFAIIVAADFGGQHWGEYVHEGGPFGLLSLLPYVPPIIGLLWLGRVLEKSETETCEK